MRDLNAGHSIASPKGHGAIAKERTTAFTSSHCQPASEAKSVLLIETYESAETNRPREFELFSFG